MIGCHFRNSIRPGFASLGRIFAYDSRAVPTALLPAAWSRQLEAIRHCRDGCQACRWTIARDLSAGKRSSGSEILPSPNALWACRAGSSVRNLWRAHVFPKWSPPTVAPNPYMRVPEDSARGATSDRTGGVLVFANDNPRGGTKTQLKPFFAFDETR